MPISYTWWQTLLQIVTNALLIGGVLGLLSALFYLIRGRPYRPNRHPLWVAVGSLVALAVGGLAFVLIQGLMPQV